MNPLVIDAGPALCFLAAGYQDLLCSAVEIRNRRLLMPQTVRGEVHGRARGRKGRPFRQGPDRLQGLIKAGRIDVLPDDVEDLDLVRHLEAVAGIPMVARLTDTDDLGEEIVIAHALKLREQGQDVVVLIDDKGGERKAKQHQLRSITTVGVLKTCAVEGLVTTRGEMREIWERIAPLDDGHPGWNTDPASNVLADKTLYVQHRAKTISV